VSSLIQSRSSPNSAVIVYCRYKDDVDYHTRRPGCPGLYANGEENLRSWLDGASSVLVATGALGAGINMPNVDLVIHLNIPYGLIEFAQESGRAGRSGQAAQSAILTCAAWEEKRCSAKQRGEEITWIANVRKLHEFMVTANC